MRKTWTLTVAVALTCAFSGGALAGADGAAVYKSCYGCHKADGAGMPGVFPPLAGHAAKLANADRAFPIRVLLYGLKGEIRVGGKTYDATMPAYGERLSDDEVAAVLNYILSRWGNDKLLGKGFKAIAASEVKAQRGRKLTPEQVHEARGKLKL